MRPSRDPAGATGGDERRPDGPTEPPDKPQGAGGRDGDARVETEVSRTLRGHAEAMGEISDEPRRPTKPHDSPDNEVECAKVGEVETSLSKASRGVQEGPGDGDDKECQPRRPDEPPNEARNPADVQVEPGGETEAEQIERAAHEDAGAEVDGEVAETRRDAEVEVESAGTRRGTSVEGERWSATTHERSSTEADEENNQRTSQDDKDVPGPSPERPPPVPTPDEPGQRRNEPPSVELEGERLSRASCDDGPTNDVTDVSGALKGDEDPRNRPKAAQNALEQVRERSKPKDEEGLPERAQVGREAPGDEADASTASEDVEVDGNQPTKLWNASEQVNERSKRKFGEDSPGRPGEEPEEPGGETAVKDDAHTYQGSPRGDTSDGGAGTNAPSRDTGPGGHRGEEEASRVVEGVRDRVKVVNGAGYDGTRPRSDGSERDVEPNAQCRRTGPLGHRGERDGLGDVEDDLERRSDGEGDEMDGEPGGKGGAMSGARRDSKRVETGPLAEDETDQHGERKRTTGDAPRPSTQPTKRPRRPTDHPNPPRRRGRLKMHPRRISTRKWTYQVTGTRRGRIGRIGPFGDVVHGL